MFQPIDRPRVYTEVGEESLTKQSFRKECDINYIMKKFQQQYGVDLMTVHPRALGGHFGDFSEVLDYRSAIEQVRKAEAGFMELPAQLREKFDNDPGRFLEFVQNPANLNELVNLGLAHNPQEISAESGNL